MATLSRENPPAPVVERPVVVSGLASEAGQLRRISWSSVVAGITLAVALQALMNLLGLAIGALTVNPVSETQPFEGLGTAAVIWDSASTLLSLFAGGWVAARLAGIPSQLDGVLHGLLVWAAALLISILLFISAAGSLINGTANLLTQVSSTTAAALQDSVPVIADATEALADAANIPLNPEALQAEAVTLIEDQTGITVEITDETGFRDALQTLATAAVPDGLAEEDIEQFQNALANTTGLTEPQIEEVVTTAESNIEALTANIQGTVQDLRVDARIATEEAAEIIAGIAGVLFASLIVGAFGAGLGGFVGAPDVPASQETYQ